MFAIYTVHMVEARFLYVKALLLSTTEKAASAKEVLSHYFTAVVRSRKVWIIFQRVHEYLYHASVFDR